MKTLFTAEKKKKKKKKNMTQFCYNNYTLSIKILANVLFMHYKKKCYILYNNYIICIMITI